MVRHIDGAGQRETGIEQVGKKKRLPKVHSERLRKSQVGQSVTKRLTRPETMA